MKQEWKSIKSTYNYIFEYPIQDESDPVVRDVVDWLQDIFGPHTLKSGWTAGIVIKPVKVDIGKPIGGTWATKPENHPLWLRVHFDVEDDATLFKLRWM